MAYGKKAHLNDNIQAIETAFRLEKQNRRATVSEREILSRYSGFGGLKCILNPARTLEDASRWAKSELDLFPQVAELHRVIRENAENEKMYNRYVDSLKNSILTAFYTPPIVVESIADALRNSGVTPARLLEPSAGTGAFVAAFNTENSAVETVAFEKDLLTGKILKALYPDANVRIEGFENIEQKHLNKFDLVTSNIPFGDVSVFDLSFSRGKSPAKQQAARSIHNYFFLKGLDSLQEGGLLAFITSQGVMNSERNTSIREYLMENSRLVSVVRLPNNLFSDYAGTEVGTDLIILQKQSGKSPDSEQEILFVESEKVNGISRNLYFDTPEKIISTREEIGTDMYGKPGVTYFHEDGVEGIAADLRQELTRQIGLSCFDISLYNGEESKKKTVFFPETAEKEKPQIEKSQPQSLSSNQEEPLLSLYDLFGFSAQERSQIASPKKNQKGQRTRNIVLPRPQPVPSKPEAKSETLSKPPVQTVQPSEKTTEIQSANHTTVPPSGVYASPLPTTEQVIDEFFARQDPFSLTNGFVDEWRLEIQHEALLAQQAKENGATLQKQTSLFKEHTETSLAPRLYTHEIKPYYREGCLLAENGQVGVLRKNDEENPLFVPLEGETQTATMY